ncbi:putative LPS assembly protein LptD [Tenacibaculum tangerinum]|uniref:LPS assembly protein LptD n=1 Tax=Tenacibaculum tangerinum TaxID=3038772 RepID=A0ABY8L3B8_9FLAO|nr:putative LPS assembly protein LptD [Tenacibaculum tangerinum]WGH75922.1 putative LPS assembly protein LptD [Tenacibaculum tangerinum]
MRANPTYILLAFFLFCFQISTAQEFGKKGISPQKLKVDSTFTSSKDSLIDIKKTDIIVKKRDTIANDSIKPKEVIDGIITHDAEDYTIQNAKNKTITLYNEAHVTYTDIDLKAGIIILDYKNNMVYAKGIKDSTGYHQRPQFKQGNQESEQDSILFNFKTKKALVYGVKTNQAGIITYGEKTKRVNDSTVYMRRLRFTTSKKKIPDYYIQTNKAKLVPGKKIIVGGSNLVLADVPTPVYLPFAYFPMTNKRTSGFIIPSWGESNSQGFFMQNGGYYFALSDYFDLTMLGDLYTNGSWGLNTSSNYYVRYKFSGSFSARYENIIRGIRGLSDYQKSTNFNIRWSHSQDAKASPNSRFSASVNLGSSKYYRQSLNEFNSSQFLNNTLSSSVSYYKKFVGTPFNMNVTATHTQNTNTETITMTLPSLQVNMDRIYPFAGKGGIKKNAIQKIGLNYSMQGQYLINTTDDEFLTAKMFQTAKKGVQHSISTNTSMKAFKYFTLTPNVSYKDVWYFDKIKKRYDSEAIDKDDNFGAVINDTLSGFTRYNEYNFGVSLSTNIYGIFPIKKGRLKGIRHTIRPSISYGYRPNFADDYNLTVQQSSDPNDLLTYSPFQGGVYGTPGSGISNSISITVNNVLEAKVAPKDPDSDEEDKKITILNNLDFSAGYNIAADSLRWSTVRANAGTRLFKDKLALNMNATFDPYQVNSEGQRINKFNSAILRLTDVGVTANYAISSKDFEKKDDDDKSEDKNQSGNGAQDTPDVFGENMGITNGFPNQTNTKEDEVKETELYKAKIPWTLNLVYAMSYFDNGLKSGIRNNSLMFSGNVELSPKWKVGFSSGYDIKDNAFTYTRLNFSRDLDSWRFNFNWTPFGRNSSYYFFIGVKASVLSDLKWDKNKPPDRVLF